MELENYNFFVNIAVHVLILFTVLTALFIYIIADLETNAVKSELDNNINNIVNKLFETSNVDINSIKNIVKQLPQTVLKKLYIKQYEPAKVSNDWLFTVMKANIAVIALLIVTMIIIPMLLCKENVNIKHILAENALTFTFVGIAEYLFFTHIAFKYVPVKPSVFITSFLDSMKSKF